MGHVKEVSMGLCFLIFTMIVALIIGIKNICDHEWKLEGKYYKLGKEVKLSNISFSGLETICEVTAVEKYKCVKCGEERKERIIRNKYKLIEPHEKEECKQLITELRENGFKESILNG